MNIKRSLFLRMVSMSVLSAFLFGSCLLAAKSEGNLEVLSYNVWYGFTKKPERKAGYLDFVKERKPDVVSLQELNGYTPEQLASDAKSWGHEHSVLLKENGFSTGITSNQPITEVRRTFEGFHHGLIRCRTHGVYFYVMHLHPGHWEIRLKEVDLLLKDLATLPNDAKVLMVGDFNTFSPRDKKVYDSSEDMVPFFRRLDKRWKSNRNLRNDELDYRHLQRLEDAGLTDLVAAKRERFLGTFPTKIRPDEDMGPPRRLDYLFASPNLAKACRSASCIVTERTSILSDHYPVGAKFVFPLQ
jgi:endonuclease/exonuclease/phosphatase family metal-dependent hydrolase